jgi:hypothetical protein
MFCWFAFYFLLGLTLAATVVVVAHKQHLRRALRDEFDDFPDVFDAVHARCHAGENVFQVWDELDSATRFYESARRHYQKHAYWSAWGDIQRAYDELDLILAREKEAR